MEAREELSAAEEAVYTAKQAVEEARRGSPDGDGLPDRHRASSIDSALGPNEEEVAEEVAEAEAEVAEVEGRLAQLELQQHVLADLIHQIQARQPPPPGTLQPSASVQSSCSEAEDSGYVPFSG